MTTTTIQQRPLRGSRISTFYPVKNLPSLASLDSAFQLQEYISLLIRLDVHDVAAIVSVPGRGSGGEKDKPTEGGEEGDKDEKDGDKERRSEVAVDEACWIYEQLRRLAQDLTHPLITTLQQECTRATCPEMKAGEWLYLCVAHGDDGAREQCCAIDYILHTLDSATALLNSPRAFPSRLSIPQTSHRHFSSLARRLGRIFAHAYFHHREAFEQAEAESSLYARFLTLTSQFDLVPAEFLVIPSPLSHIDGRDDLRRVMDVQPPRLLGAAIHPQLDVVVQDRLGVNAEWVHEKERAKSASPPGFGHQPGGESPRRIGRNRTDTMVFSEAVGAAEELAKLENDGDIESISKAVETETAEQSSAHTVDDSSPPAPDPTPDSNSSTLTDEGSASAEPVVVPVVLIEPADTPMEAPVSEPDDTSTEPLPLTSIILSEHSADPTPPSPPSPPSEMPEPTSAEPEVAEANPAPDVAVNTEVQEATDTAATSDDVLSAVPVDVPVIEEEPAVDPVNVPDADIPRAVAPEQVATVDLTENESLAAVDIEHNQEPEPVESQPPADRAGDAEIESNTQDTDLAEVEQPVIIAETHTEPSEETASPE